MTTTSRDHVPPRTVLEARKRMNDAVRRFFDTRGFLEVETPIAVLSPGLEPHLEAFETEAWAPGRPREQLYLHTSPEYAMKRLVGRVGSIYQIARVFRNGERSATHAPEFTMLEWYRHPGQLEDLFEDTSSLVDEVAAAIDGPWRPAGPAELRSISEAFADAGLGDPLDHLEDLEGLRAALKVPRHEGDDWDAVFFRAFFDAVERQLPTDRVSLLHGYPAPMAALARLDPADPRRALRFEAFVGPLELGNAFAELSDPDEQRVRFEADLALRTALGRQTPPIDEGLLADLPMLEPCAGLALGLDRLLMKCLGLDAIQDVLCFSPRGD